MGDFNQRTNCANGSVECEMLASEDGLFNHLPPLCTKLGKQKGTEKRWNGSTKKLAQIHIDTAARSIPPAHMHDSDSGRQAGDDPIPMGCYYEV